MLKRILQALGLSKKEEKGPYDDILQSVRDFQNRPIHKELTAEIIDNAPDDNLLQIVFDNLNAKIPEDYDKHYETVMSWNKSRQAIYFTWCLEGDVVNGGFNQFYFNSNGKFYRFIPDALRLLGFTSFAELVQQANDTYEKDYAKITEDQDGTLEGFAESYEDNPLNVYDKLFYELQEKEDLGKKMVPYIRSHQSDFIDK